MASDGGACGPGSIVAIEGAPHYGERTTMALKLIRFAADRTSGTDSPVPAPSGKLIPGPSCGVTL